MILCLLSVVFEGYNAAIEERKHGIMAFMVLFILLTRYLLSRYAYIPR